MISLAIFWPLAACVLILAETALLFWRNRRRNRLLLISRALGRLYLAAMVVWIIFSPALSAVRRDNTYMALTAIFCVEVLAHLTRWVEFRRAGRVSNGQ